MSKHRRDSINGKMKVIGRFSEWGCKKKSGKSFFRPKSMTSVQVPPDELDDIELLENIVLELIDFDWEDFERQRIKSIFYKKAHVRPNVRKSQFKEMLLDAGAVQSIDVSDDDISETESVVSKGNIHRLRSEDFIHQLSKDGKAKLKFIMQFAQSGNTLAATTTLRDLSPQDRLRIRNSIHHARLSKLYNPGKRRSTMLSLKSKGSILSRNTRKSILQRRQNDTLQDKFARMKGYRNKIHMEKSLERFRGFEELRDETQINLMAEENGYKSGKVMDMLDEKNIELDYGVEIDISDSDNETEQELEEFINLDDNNLEELLDKWEVESPIDSEDDSKTNQRPVSKKEKLKHQELRKKKAVREGWDQKHKRPSAPNSFMQKLLPKDSLTSKQLDIFNSEE